MSKAKRKGKRTAVPQGTDAEKDVSAAVPSTAPETPPALRLPSLSLLLVLLAALLPYLNSLGNGYVPEFHQDIATRHVQGPSAPGYFFTADFWEEHNQGRSNRYQPLVPFSYAVNHWLGTLTPFGCHLTSLVLHVLVCLLLLMVLRLILPHRMLALPATLLFAVFPLHTEAVSSMDGRAQLLSALFFLAAWLVHLYTWPPAGPLKRDWRRQAGMTLAAMALFMLALCSAGSAVALVPVVLLGDLLRFRPAPRKMVRKSEDEFFTPDRPSAQKVYSFVIRRFSPLPGAAYAGLLAVLACYLALRHQVLGSLTGEAAIPFLHNPLAAEATAVRIMTTVKVVGIYIWLQLWPVLLSADYSFNQVKLAVSPVDPGFLAALTCCLALLVGAIQLWRTGKRRVPAVGILFFFSTIIPVSSIFFTQDTIMAERLLYLPSLGFCIILAWLLDQIIHEFGGIVPGGDKGTPHPLWQRRLVLGLTVLLVLGYTARTVVRNRDWRDQQTLLLSAAAVSPDSARVHGELGVGYFNLGEYTLAAGSLERALDILPDYPIALYMLGRSRIERGELEGARKALVQATELRPDHPEILLALGAVDFRLGHLDEATDFFRQTLELAPGNRWAQESLGITLSQRGLYEEAIGVFRSSLEQYPGSVTVSYHLASALGSAERLEEAEAVYRAVLELDPEHQGSLLGLADICHRTDREEEADALRAQARSDTP